MFGLLLGGVYTAYKHFSGLDPLKLDPQSVLKNVLVARTPKEFIAVLSSLKLDSSLFKKNNIIKKDNQVEAPSKQVVPVLSKYIFRFLLVADSHNDSTNLKKAISQAKADYPDISFIIGLGDYTNVGTIGELKSAKAELDLSGLRYFLLAGDHDLWDSRNRNLAADTDFKEVFGPLYQAFTYENYRFLLLDNSDDYLGLGEIQSKWITTELQKPKTDSAKGVFIFIHEPLYHPSSDHVMGKIEKDLKSQARNLTFQLKTAGVKKIFAGDIHNFSEYTEPETKLEMVTVGAVTSERNPQAPRFAVVKVFEDGSTKVEDIEIR